MIRSAVATRFVRIATNGRNLPLLVVVETSDGVEHEAYLKASARPEVGVEGLANEAIAACLAGDLGLPILEPFLVTLDTAWVASIGDAETRTMLQSSASVGFASELAGPQWQTWGAGNILKPDMVAQALAIFAFDALISNDDRKVVNPNLLVRGDDLRIIDHEAAFRLAIKLFPKPEPWKPGNLNRMVDDGGHIFAKHLKGKALSFQVIQASWTAISPNRTSEYGQMLPAQWAAASGPVQAALAYINTTCARISDCITELERVLK